LFDSQELPPTGIPVLDQVRKAGGDYNFNNQQLIAINRYYTSDGIQVVRRFPASYVVGLIISNRLFFSPSNMNAYFSAGNRAAAHPMEVVFNPLLYGVGVRPGSIQQPHFGFSGPWFLEVSTSWSFFALWWAFIAYGYVQARKAFLARQSADMPRAIVIGFIIFSMLYIYGVGTAFELAENYRYRWVVEPLTFVIGATTVTHLVHVLRARLASRRVARISA
jgi:hypothetical protein